MLFFTDLGHVILSFFMYWQQDILHKTTDIVYWLLCRLLCCHSSSPCYTCRVTRQYVAEVLFPLCDDRARLAIFLPHYKTHGYSVRFEFHNECDTLDKSEQRCRTFALHFDEIHATLGVYAASSPDVDAVHMFLLVFHVVECWCFEFCAQSFRRMTLSTASVWRAYICVWICSTGWVKYKRGHVYNTSIRVTCNH